ncbi:gluconate:H+ symporter [Sporomusa acidovorans]|uniref:D-serine transporter DsdX n=1 Tax=Sporomusa acidovorans (strain ATCC 49682 / DSM 3132 / Mol) TaxID=1123286 RepID=A0ABZ3J0Q0_SPOA4|nr:gluconate:H+ symporter [Sporomusa acidovorans]OZC22856.1 DsdX permease [Sporomusa acidovorans DSM 3132]SDE53160.1 gluconate permease GntT [Sporomusa acidovorans]
MGTTGMLMLVLILAISLIIFLTIRLKIHAFVALLTACLFIGFTTGMPLDKMLKSIELGMGGFLGMLAPILALGAIVGKMMEVSGGAERLSRTMIKALGKRNSHWAMMIVGYICGIPVFFQVGIVLLMPLLFCVAIEAGMSLVTVGIPMIIGLLTVHCIVPPHPAAMAVAVGLKADVGKVILYGLIVGLPAAALAGPIFGKLVGNKFKLNPPEHLCKAEPTPEENLPPFGITLFTILFPLLLMISKTILEFALGKAHPCMAYVNFIGDPVTALFLAVILSYWTLGLNRGMDMERIRKFSEIAIGPMAAILLIIGASGAFNKILMDSGIGAAIKSLLMEWHINPLVLAWCVAAIMRFAVGGATIAMITAVGLVVPLLPLYPGLDPALVAVAIGTGSIGFSHVNDPGFWFVKEYFGMPMGDLFKTYTLSSTIASVAGLITLLIFSQFIS